MLQIPKHLNYNICFIALFTFVSYHALVYEAQAKPGHC